MNSKLLEVCLEQEVLFEGKVIIVQKDTVLLPDGKKATREIVHHPGAVGIISLLEKDILMVAQYRYALEMETLEIPAGKIDPGETPERCAVRELREETGYQGDMTYLGGFYASPGFADEIVHLYLAQNLQWAPLQTDVDEFLDVQRLPYTEALTRLRQGEIKDAKTALALLLVEKMLV